MEQRYVNNWLMERQQLLHRLALRAADGAPGEDRAPITDADAQAYGPVAELRAGLRANAVPLDPYEERLEADLLGDDLYAGGGPEHLAVPRGAPTVLRPALPAQCFYIGSSSPLQEAYVDSYDVEVPACVSEGVLANPDALASMIRSYYHTHHVPRDGDGTSPVPLYLLAGDLDMSWAALILRRLRCALIAFHPRLRWWQQVNSSPLPLDLSGLGYLNDDIATGGGKRGRGDLTAVETTADPNAVYNPHYSLAPHCLFACALTVAKLPPTLDNVLLLRDAVEALLALALRKGLLVAGYSVLAWAHHLHFDVEEFVTLTSSAPYRLGNVLDGYLISLVLGCSVWIYDIGDRPHMLSHSSPPQLCIKHNGEEHFYVIRLPNDSHVAHPVFVHEMLSDLPLTNINYPVTSRMMSRINRHILGARDEAFVRHVHIHSHCPQQDAHIRYIFAYPVCNYAQFQLTIPTQCMPVFLNESVWYIDLPPWTALVRVLAEVDTLCTTDGNLADLLDRAEHMAIMQATALLDRALDVALDPEFLDLALHILDRTMVEYPSTFMRHLFKYRFYCNFDNQRVTWMEFQHQCGLQSTLPRQYLYVCCPHPERMPRSTRHGPLMYLSVDQVSPVTTAIWDRLGCALMEAPEGTLDEIHTAHQDIYISDTLPYSELDTAWLLQGGAPKRRTRAPSSDSSGPDLEGFEHLYHINYNEREDMAEVHVLSTGTRTRITTQAYNGFVVHIPRCKLVRDVLLLLKRRLRINIMRLTLESSSRVLLPTDALPSSMSTSLRIARPMRHAREQTVLRRPAAARSMRRPRPENFNFRNEHMLGFAAPGERSQADVELLRQCQVTCDSVSVIFDPELAFITDGSSFFVIIHGLDGSEDKRRVVCPPNFTISMTRLLVSGCLREDLGPAFFYCVNSKIFLDDDLPCRPDPP
eukprot:2832810-Amphidinium_carterae.1